MWSSGGFCNSWRRHDGKSCKIRPGDTLDGMLEVAYLVLLVAAFLTIGLISVFIVYKLFAGQR